MTSPPIVGLTGGIGAGKGRVAEMFRALGVPVWDADAAGHAVYRNHLELRDAVAERWGDKVRKGVSDVNRTAIARIVFAQPEELQWLNEQVHPRVQADFAAFVRQASSDAPYVMREAAVLFESGADKDCAAVIAVVAPEAERVHRAMLRDQRTEDQIRDRLHHQLTDSERIARADHVIVNHNGVTASELQLRVQEVHQLLMNHLS